MKLSLRSKLLILLILVPTIGLALYATRAIRLVTEDKKAYVFDSAVIIAKALATQTRIELDFFDGLVAPILSSVDTGTMKFSKDSYKFFTAQSRVEHIFLFRKNPAGAYVAMDQMYLPKRHVQNYTPGGELLEILTKTADDSGFAIQDIPDAKRYFLIAVKRESEKRTDTHIVLALYQAPDLYEAFAAPSAYRNYLLTRFNFLAMEPKYVRKKKWREQIGSVDFFKPIFNNRFPVGTAEIKGNTGESMLVSFAEVGRSGLLAASVVERAVAMEAVRKLIIESALFLLTLLSVLILIGIMASFKLTSALQHLVQVTKQIAGGQYKVKININSGDEVGQLAGSISTMAAEITKSMAKTAENVRLTSELHTVKLIQDMMIPKGGARIGSLNIDGHYQPASECGGDWYHYSPMGSDRVFLWIGDVTGHGASAALITAAAKAVSAVVEIMPEISPAMALKLLNHAIFSTAKGEVLMTFLILSIDLNTGMVTYAVASHESGFVLPPKDVLSKKDFTPLCEVNGPRLGEGVDAEYEEARYQLNPGDTMFLYTDGILDLRNSKSQPLGEREMIKMISTSFSSQAPMVEKIENIKREMESYRGGAPLRDDVTILVAQYLP